jgi:RNA polymerase primary sigma factor
VTAPILPKLAGTELGGRYCGRRGLPDEWVDRMYADWQRLRSLRAVGRIHARSNQTLAEIFKRRGLTTSRKLLEPIVYKGHKYTLSKGGYRRTDGRERLHRGSLLHHVVWSEHNGPIPPGYRVTFKNGDHTDHSPDNLLCLAIAEMSRRNATGENQHTKAKAEERVEANMGFIVQQAQRYAGKYGVSMDDLIQEGRMAIVRASRKFDGRRGVKFLSYAGIGIQRAMRQFAQDHCHIIRVPANRFHEVPVHQVSTDQPIGEDGDETLGDVLLSQEESVTGEVDCGMTAEALSRIVGRLPKRMRAVLRGRFWEHKTLEQLGAELGLTRERIRQIEVEALRRLRRSRILKEVA